MSVRDRNSERQTTACNTCKRRKRRCDGLNPCKTCRAKSLPCKYEPELDRRKPTSERLVAALQARVDNALGQDPQTTSLLHDFFIPYRGLGHLQNNTTPLTDPQRIPGRLVFSLNKSSNGELEYRGPTSSVPNNASAVLGVNPDEKHRTTDSENDLEIQSFMPDVESLAQNVDLFLEWQNSSIVILSGTLVDDLLRSYSPLSCCSKRRLLILSILALTHKFQPKTGTLGLSGAYVSDQYFEKANKILLGTAFSAPCVEVILSACILACREYGCGHENSAWTLNGIAASISDILGLHVGGDYEHWVASGHLSTADVEVRVIAYWAAVVIDRTLASCLGRHPFLHPTDFSTPLIRLQLPTGHVRIPEFGTSDYEQNILNTFRYSVDFWKFNDKSLSEIYDFRNDVSTVSNDKAKAAKFFEKLASMVTKYRLELILWQRSLPKSIKLSRKIPVPHTIVFEMIIQNCFILMHRPFILAAHHSQAPDTLKVDPEKAFANICSSICTKSALEITSLIRLYKTHYSLQCIVFSVIHCLLSASTIHIFDLDSKEASVSRSATNALHTCVEVLEEISSIWAAATKALKIIDSLLKNMGRAQCANTDASGTGGFRFENSYAAGYMETDLFAEQPRHYEIGIGTGPFENLQPFLQPWPVNQIQIQQQEQEFAGSAGVNTHAAFI